MSIECRLAKLEANNRFLKGLVLLTMMLAVLPWAMGSQPATRDNVQAKRFTLVGDNDVPLGAWAFDAETKTATFSVQLGESAPSIVLESTPDTAIVRLVSGVRQQLRNDRRRVGLSPIAELSNADIALSVGKNQPMIDVDDGTVTIYRRGKPTFTVPPKTSVVPVGEN